MLIPVGVKASKKDLIEIFNMDAFFKSSPSNLHLWKSIIDATFSSDKDRFLELLSESDLQKSGTISQELAI